jgi:competence ComEA-like helix-hairpin-helix protein
MMKRAPALRVFAVLLLLCSPSALAKKKPPPQPVNINTANSAELQQVPGIGPATAEKILQMRKSYGAFKSVDDLLAIRGLGPKRLEKMRKYLVAGKAASAGKSQATGCAGCNKAKSPPTKAAPPKASTTALTDTQSSSEPEEPER